MTQYFSYIFWPRPPQIGYDSPKLIALLSISVAFIVLSFVIRLWRKRVQNPQTKKLSRSWSTATIWFGVIGLILAVSRAEDISYVSMRLWWVVWGVSLALYLLFQVKIFRARHYEVLPQRRSEDAREKYLPKKKAKL